MIEDDEEQMKEELKEAFRWVCGVYVCVSELFRGTTRDKEEHTNY